MWRTTAYSPPFLPVLFADASHAQMLLCFGVWQTPQIHKLARSKDLNLNHERMCVTSLRVVASYDFLNNVHRDKSNALCHLISLGSFHINVAAGYSCVSIACHPDTIL